MNLSAIKPWVKELIQLMQKEIELFIARIPEDQRVVTTHLKNWSSKDEVNHLIFWNNVFIFNVQARQKNLPLLDPNNYLVMNDVAWFYGKGLTWKEIGNAIEKVFNEEQELVNSMSAEELTDGNTFTLGYTKSHKAFLEDFMYEIVDHPLHHMVGMYEKFGNKKNAKEMLLRINEFIQNPDVKKWTSKSRNKIAKYLKTL